MAIICDEQHAAYDQQQRANKANIGLGSQRTAFDQQQASSSNYGTLQLGLESRI